MQVKKEDLKKLYNLCLMYEDFVFNINHNFLEEEEIKENNILLKNIKDAIKEEERKTYLKDATIEEVKEIIKNNDNIINNYYEYTYDLFMELQEEEFHQLFTGDVHKYLLINDHYNSFYLRIRDYQHFNDNLDKNYLTIEELDFYNKINQDYKNNLLSNEEILRKDDEFLNMLENRLHQYENVEKDDVINYIIDNELYKNYYYLDDNKNILYLDINKKEVF